MFFKHFSPPQPFSIPAALSQLLSLPAVASYCFSSPFSPCSQSEVMALKCWSVPITPLQFPPTGLRKRSKLLSVTTHYEHNTRHFSLYLAPFCSFLSHCSPLCLQIQGSVLLNHLPSSKLAMSSHCICTIFCQDTVLPTHPTLFTWLTHTWGFSPDTSIYKRLGMIFLFWFNRPFLPVLTLVPVLCLWFPV